MGDKSPKSKQRGQSQKDALKTERASQAKSKQDRQSHAPQLPAKGKKSG